MDFPERGRQIIRALYEANPGLASGTPDQQRLLTRLIGEQFAFEFGPRWGCKAATKDRPQGPSELAYQGPPLQIWRWSDGDGHITGVPGAPLPEPLLQPAEQSAGQYFILTDPVDHLHVSDQRPPARPPDPPAPPVDLTPILARLDTLEKFVASLMDQWPALHGDVELLLSRMDQRYVTIDMPFRIKVVSLPELVVQRAEAQKQTAAK